MNKHTEESLMVKIDSAFTEADGKFLLFNKLFNLAKFENVVTENDIAWVIFQTHKKAEQEKLDLVSQIRKLEERNTKLENDLSIEKASVHDKVKAIISTIDDHVTKQRAASVYHKMTKPRPEYTATNPHPSVKSLFSRFSSNNVQTNV